MERLLQINTTAAGAAPAAVARQIALEADAAGDQALLCYGRGPMPGPEIHAMRFGTPLATGLHGASTRLLDRHGLGSRAATRELLRIIANYAPTRIHLHNLHGYYLHYPTLAEYLRHCGIPVTWTLHDCWAFTGHCAYPVEHRCERYKEGCGHCPGLKSYPRTLFHDGSAHNLRTKQHAFSGIPGMTIHTVSDWLGDQVRRTYLAQYPVVTVHPRADSRQFSPAAGRNALRSEWGVGPGQRLVVGVANFAEPRKGFNDFLALRQLLPDTWKILLVGLTPKQLHILPDGILGTGRIHSAQRLRQVYTAADILFHPTRADTYSMTVAEAALCGTPSVVYNTCGAHEAIVPGMGTVIPPSVTEAARAIRQTLGDWE